MPSVYPDKFVFGLENGSKNTLPACFSDLSQPLAITSLVFYFFISYCLIYSNPFEIGIKVLTSVFRGLREGQAVVNQAL